MDVIDYDFGRTQRLIAGVNAAHSVAKKAPNLARSGFLSSPRNRL